MADTSDRIKDGIDDAATKVKQATDTAGEKGRVILGEVKDRMSDARDQGRAAIREGASCSKKAVDQATDKVGDLTNVARNFVEQSVEQSKEGYQQIAEHAEEGVRRAGAMVQANPGTALTLVFAVGFGIGFLFSQLPRRQRERSWFMR